MTKSTLLNKFRSSSGSVYKKWVSESEGTFYTKSTPEDSSESGGRVSQQSFAGAHAHTGDLNVKIPNPDGEGMINVSEEDASKAGRAANYDKPKVDIQADDTRFLESIGKSFTAEEIRQAYETQGQITDEIVQYL